MARIPMFVDGVSTEEMPMLLDTKQAGAILNVTPRTVTRMCEQGKLKAVRVMSLWRINRDALLESCGLLGGGEE